MLCVLSPSHGFEARVAVTTEGGVGKMVRKQNAVFSGSKSETSSQSKEISQRPTESGDTATGS